MADIFLLIFGIIGSLTITLYVYNVVKRAKESRPVIIVELIPANTEKSAKTVELEPYMESIKKQFSKNLDD
ncbi:MAG: hypothetical protein FWD40_05680 [Treponema sp.]|nr:hypothetical protein [Treponema sp.]